MASDISRRLAAGGRRNCRRFATSRRLQFPNRLAAGPTARPGFTLVEMLVVITIIGILASLGTVAVFEALKAAKRARIKVEITNLNNAIESYKVQFGDYPPSYFNGQDANSVAALQRHLAKAFPRCNVNTELSYLPSNGMTPAEFLVFWLTSISKDPARPLSAPTTDRQSLFSFDKTRLALSPRGNSALPPGWSLSGSGASAVLNPYNPQIYYDQSGKNSPFVYFEARGYLGHALQSVNSPSYMPNCCPYLQEPWITNNHSPNNIVAGTSGPPQQDVQTDSSGNWLPASYQKMCANPKSFQIISAGLDGVFGGLGQPMSGVKYNNKTGLTLYYKSFPTGTGYDTTGGDDDNLTNFSQGQLGDSKP
jgi:prepilin-type N-terminal cleavage/methylation domain-containing protein